MSRRTDTLPMAMTKAKDLVELIGSLAGIAALVWHMKRWWTNRRRRSRQESVELDHLAKIRKGLLLSHTDEINKVRSRVSEEKLRVAQQLASSGLRSSGWAEKRLRDFQESINREVESAMRRHSIEISDIDRKISEIKNRPRD